MGFLNKRTIGQGISSFYLNVNNILNKNSVDLVHLKNANHNLLFFYDPIRRENMTHMSNVPLQGDFPEAPHQGPKATIQRDAEKLS